MIVNNQCGLTRRTLLSLIACTPLAISCSLMTKKQASAELGIQLFSVRTLLDHDFEGTLKALSDIGLTNVETIGSQGRAPNGLADSLKKYNLTSSSYHLVPRDLFAYFSNNFPKNSTAKQRMKLYLDTYSLANTKHLVGEAIAEAKILGQKYIVWPVLFPKQYDSRQAINQVIESFNLAGEMCSRSGCVFAFHSHDRELLFRIGDEKVYDIILRHTNPKNVKMQLDTYWFAKSGVDPLQYIAAQPERYHLAHLKDIDATGNMTDAGNGTLDFKAILSALKAAGAENFYVENDDALDQLASAKIAYSNMAALI